MSEDFMQRYLQDEAARQAEDRRRIERSVLPIVSTRRELVNRHGKWCWKPLVQTVLGWRTPMTEGEVYFQVKEGEALNLNYIPTFPNNGFTPAR